MCVCVCVCVCVCLCVRVCVVLFIALATQTIIIHSALLSFARPKHGLLHNSHGIIIVSVPLWPPTHVTHVWHSKLRIIEW